MSRAIDRPGVALCLLLFAGAAQGHASQVAIAEVVIQPRDVEIALSVNMLELDLLLGLDRDGSGSVEPAELLAARNRVEGYLGGKVVVSSGGRDLPLRVEGLEAGQSGDGRAVARILLHFPSGGPLREVAIRCEPLADLGPGHRTLATIHRDGAVEQFVFEPGSPFRSSAADPWARVGRLLKLGILHIFTGYDHVLFLVGLLLAAAGLVEVLKIATSFTVAHSVTMSLAALGLVHLPPRLIEAGIAVSIAWVAAENLLRRERGRRWLLSFSFGLVHGFGFANVLSAMHLPRAGIASSLLAFNAGVEFGQVAIILAVFPLLLLLRRSGAYARVMSSASALLLVAGLFWLWQRAF